MVKKEELSPELLRIICCPIDKADLIYDKKAQTLTCIECKFIYPIREGIPILLPPQLHDKRDIECSRRNGWEDKGLCRNPMKHSDFS